MFSSSNTTASNFWFPSKPRLMTDEKQFFCRTKLCTKHGYSRHAVSVRLSVTFVDHVTDRDSSLIAGYRRLLDVRSAKTFTDDEAEYMTQSATHHWLSIYCWTCELRSDKNSYRQPCSVDRTVGDARANVCLWRRAAWANTPKRREQKRI